MPNPIDEQLSRDSIQTRKHIAAAQASTEDGHAHTRSSRRAIERSLRLLSEPFHKGWGYLS